MTFQAQNLVYVYYNGAGLKQQIGRLLLKNRQLFFEYNTDFLKTGLELSPFKLPLKTGIFSAQYQPFEGLFGLFNDSLPDGWGRLLLDRKLMKAHLNPLSLSPLDRLCFVGDKGMGALSYEPENPNFYSTLPSDLDEIEHEIKVTLEDDDRFLDDLFILNGSSAGARPKILTQVDQREWLIKFRSSFDPLDISAIEYAYHQMAQTAGLIIPHAKLFPSQNGIGFFGVERFDKQQTQRIHTHTIAGLIHADHRAPSLDYQSILRATLYLTKDLKQCENLFRQAVFNVFSHNRDDHSKNFSFLMNANGQWSLSPAYDLTFSSGPAGEHSTTIMGEGKSPARSHLLKLADSIGIEKTTALSIISQVLEATTKWPEYAKNAGVSKIQVQTIEKALKKTRKTT
jgi:serine/threonine-protein kinase HipA